MEHGVKLVNPEAPAPVSGALPAQRRIEQSGLRLGILDNSKGNADHLLNFLVEGIKAASVPIASVLRLAKANAGIGAPAAILEQFVAEADFVLTAMAD